MEFSLDRFYQINRKAIIWVILFGLIYVLRQFFTLIFLTYIIGFFAIPLAGRLKERLGLTRGFSIALVYGGLFVGYIALCALVIPSAVRQVAGMQGRLPGIKASLFNLRDEYTEKHRGAAKILGIYAEPSLLRDDDLLRAPQKFYRQIAQEIEAPAPNPGKRIMELLPEETRKKLLEAAAPRTSAEPQAPLLFSETEDDADVEILRGLNEMVLRRRDFYRAWDFGHLDLMRNPKIAELIQRNRAELLDREVQRLNRLLLEAAYPEFIAKSQVAEDELEARLDAALIYLQSQMPKFAGYALEFFLTSVLAIFFSFLIAYDFGRLSREVRSLAGSKLRDFYEEAAQPVIRFALSVGHGFQSVVMLSLATTLLTVPALFILQVPSVTVLGVITFLSGLVPLIGTPVCISAVMLVALNENGAASAITAGVTVLLIQIVSYYAFGRLLRGRHVKINLAAVVGIMFVGYKLGGVWGLVLGVPVANCVLRDIFKVPFIEDRDDEPAEDLPGLPTLLAEPGPGNDPRPR